MPRYNAFVTTVRSSSSPACLAWKPIDEALIGSTGEYTSLPQLIARNTDYLIDSISMRMKHLGLYPNTPQVLHAILEYGILKAETPTTERRTEAASAGSDSSHIDDIVWLLDDTIQSVFNGTPTNHRSTLQLAIIR
jgi:hypothetical protein